MRNSLIVLAALAIMALGVYGSAVILLDQERIKAMIADQIEQQTGRRVEIHGDVRLRLFPGLRISAERVVMTGPEGFEGPDLFQADEFTVQVRLLPLVRGQVDPTLIQVNGVRVNLHEDDQGRSSLDGLKRLIGSERPDRNGMGASVALENIVISTGRAGRELRESFELERMEVEGFALGQPLQFRFRGSLGEPALFDFLEVDGLLVTTEADRLRLSNMRMAGMVDQGRYDLEILGNVNLALDDHLNFSLDGGKLKFNEHQFDLNLRYAGTERPSFSARLGADLIDVDVIQVIERIAEVPGLPDHSGLKMAMRGMDFDVDLGIEQIATLGLVIDQLAMRVTGRQGLVQIQSLQGKVPGAIVQGGGELDLRILDSDWQVDLDLDVVDLAPMLKSLRLDWMIDGAGSVTMDLQSSRESALAKAGWSGTAQVELVDGAWPLLESMTEGLEGIQGDDRFDFLAMNVSFNDQRVNLTDLQLFSESLELEGDLALTMESGEMLGRVDLLTEVGLVQAEIRGTLDHPEADYGPVVLRPAQ